MAVTNAAVKPLPPPTPKIVALLLTFVGFILAPMQGLVWILRVMAQVLPYLCFMTAWIISAGTAAKIVARHTCREGSTLLASLDAFTHAAFKICICGMCCFLVIAAVLLCILCLAYMVAVVSGSGSEFKKTVFGEITWESIPELFKLPRAAVLGLVADLACIPLIVAGILAMIMSPHVDGSISQGQMIGSLIMDVGIFGIHAISCFIIIPAFAIDIWRKDQVTENQDPLWRIVKT